MSLAMQGKFKKMKRKAIKMFYSIFVNDLKECEPRKWYLMLKRLGAFDQMNSGEIGVDELEGSRNKASAEKNWQSFCCSIN